MVAVRSYQAGSDAAGAYALWGQTLGSAWPLTRRMFANVVDGAATGTPGTCFVATEHGRIVGFIASAIHRPASGDRGSGSGIGFIPVLLVAPDAQRRGIGTALHDTALDHLRSAGTRGAQLGGGLIRFWPGIPRNLPAAVAFFQARGWDCGEIGYDLLQDLRPFTTPAALQERLAKAPFRIAPGVADDMPELLAFQDREFPFWADAYRDAAHYGDYDDALLARDAAGRLVGALLMVTPRSHPDRTDAPWAELFGGRLGGLGAVGVAADQRGSGVGIALVARGTEALRERGARYSFIGWTTLVDFYGRVGYTVWRDYTLGRREL